MNRFVLVTAVVICLAVLLVGNGCSRSHYYQKADAEVYSLLHAGKHNTKLDVRDYRIEPDTKSRTAHICDDWKKYLPTDNAGYVSLNTETSVDLALLHSPEYQSAKENLYLAATDVSKERYRFDVQYFGGDSVFYTLSGRLKGERATLAHQPFARGEMLTATGGELAAGLANAVTWTFNGHSNWSADSILNVSLVQPLLRGSSRQIVLESLTQTERDFLAVMRQMVYFQQGFYTQIVTGNGAQPVPAGTSSASNTPHFSGGFYSLLAEQIYIQNQRKNIIGLEENLQRFIEIFEAGQVSDVYQVEETRQSLLNSESSFLSRVSQYETSVETFLRSLGLPPDLKVKIDDPLMQKFQLSSPTLTDLQNDVGVILAAIRKKDQPLPDNFKEKLTNVINLSQSEVKVLQKDLEALEQQIPLRITALKKLEETLADKIAQGERIDKNVYDTAVFEDRVKKLKTIDIPRNLSRIAAAVTLLETIINTDEAVLRKNITEKSFAPNITEALDTLKLLDTSVLDSDTELLKKQKELEAQQTELESLQKAFDTTVPVKPLQDKQKIIAELRKKNVYRDWIRRILSAFQYELVSLSLMQTRTRLEAITLEPNTMTPEAALEIAAANRLDWTSQRWALQDARRHIEIAADRLKGDLNVTFDGKLGTIDENGVDFGSKTGQMTLGLAWDSPLTRHNEMLDYRRAEIAYQDARRDYYTFVDSVNAQLRQTLRSLRIHQIEFEIARNAILTDAVRVDVMQLRMEQPPQRGQKIDTSTARDLISALNGFMSSQNAFLDTWVKYQTQKMMLDLNTGTMRLNGAGHWIQAPDNKKAAEPDPTLAPIPVPTLNRRYL